MVTKKLFAFAVAAVITTTAAFAQVHNGPGVQLRRKPGVVRHVTPVHQIQRPTVHRQVVHRVVRPVRRVRTVRRPVIVRNRYVAPVRRIHTARRPVRVHQYQSWPRYATHRRAPVWHSKPRWSGGHAQHFRKHEERHDWKHDNRKHDDRGHRGHGRH